MQARLELAEETLPGLCLLQRPGGPKPSLVVATQAWPRPPPAALIRHVLPPGQRMRDRVRRAFALAAGMVGGQLGGEEVCHVPMGSTMEATSRLVNAVYTSGFTGPVARVPWAKAGDVLPPVLSSVGLLQFMSSIWSMKKHGRKPRLKYHVPFGASHGISPLGCKIDEATSTDDDRSLLIITLTLVLVADACHCPPPHIRLHHRSCHNLVYTGYLPFDVVMAQFCARHQDLIVPPKKERLAAERPTMRRRGRGGVGGAMGPPAPVPERKFRGVVVKVPHPDNPKLRLLIVSPKAMICAGCKVAQQNMDALAFIWHLLQADGPGAIRPSGAVLKSGSPPPAKRFRGAE